MRTILHAMGIMLLALGISIIDLFLKNILPYPFNALNSVFVFLMLFLIFADSGKVVWLSFFTHTLLDIYSTHTFGILLSAGTIAILLEYWFYRDFFTNKSIWSLMAMTASGLVIFRVLYTLCILFTRDILWADMSLYYMWEMIFTLISTVIGYGAMRTIFSRLKIR